MRPYRRGILQSRSHDCFIGSNECLLLFTPSCCCECFYHFLVDYVLVLRCECVCCMYILGLRHGPFGCVAMGSAVFI